MDTSSVIGISSASSLLVTVVLYIMYRICNHCHLTSKCCDKETSIDFDTSQIDMNKPINIK